MRLYYRPKGQETEYDITGDAMVEEARALDGCGGRRDGLEICVSGAGAWKKWHPEADDTMRATLNGYDTGRMYVSACYPEGDRYTIYASGCPRMSRAKRNRSWHGETLGKIFDETAAYCGMGWALYGMEGEMVYPYMAQREGAEAFLDRLMRLEGGRVKTWDGKMLGIGTEWAMKRDPAASIQMEADTPGVYYMRREDVRLGQVTVRTPWGEGSAADTLRGGLGEEVICLPARSAAEARRWARGILLERNMGAETLEMTTDFKKEYTAMARVDVTGDREAAGQWLIEEAEHDLVRETSRVRMHRCVWTVY